MLAVRSLCIVVTRVISHFFVDQGFGSECSDSSFALPFTFLDNKIIRKTSPCNEHPLTPHFYIVKLGFTGVYIFSYFCSKHRLWVLVRTASMRRF